MLIATSSYLRTLTTETPFHRTMKWKDEFGFSIMDSAMRGALRGFEPTEAKLKIERVQENFYSEAGACGWIFMVHQFSGHISNADLVRQYMDVIVEDRFHPRLGFRGSLSASFGWRRRIYTVILSPYNTHLTSPPKDITDHSAIANFLPSFSPASSIKNSILSVSRSHTKLAMQVSNH